MNKINIAEIWSDSQYNHYKFLGIDACGCSSLFIYRPIIKIIECNYIWARPWWKRLLPGKDVWIKCCDTHPRTEHCLYFKETLKLYKRPNITPEGDE